MNVLSTMQKQSDDSKKGPVQFRADMAPRYAALLQMALESMPEGAEKKFIELEILLGNSV
jgi:hypothetical protein